MFATPAPFTPRPNRVEVLHVKLTSDELQITRQLAKREGTTQADLVRGLIAERWAKQDDQPAVAA